MTDPTWPPPYPYGWPTAPPPPPPPPSPPARRVSRWPGRLLVLLVVLAVGFTGWHLRDAETLRIPQVALSTEAPVVVPQTLPTPGHRSADAPLGTPPPAPDSDVFTFVEFQDDGVTPVAYDPCRPVEVVLAADGAPAGAEGLLTEALARMSAVTGLRFDYQGLTDEVPGDGRAAYQPDRYGDRWAPVLVGWRTPEQYPDLAGDVAGLGGSAAAAASGPTVFVTGSVTLDGPEYAELLADGDTGLARAILLHELGHVVGLGHVWDDDQLMAASTSGKVLDFADGDLAGLARLGAGACAPDL